MSEQAASPTGRPEPGVDTSETAEQSGFTSDKARRRYLNTYDAVLRRVWPGPVDATSVRTRFGDVRVLRSGPTTNSPVVLVSGAGANALAWYRYAEPLSRERGVVAVDPLGEPGYSSQAAPIASGADAGGWLDDVLAGLGAEGAHVVGASYGGWTVVEQQLAGGGRVGALTLVDPVGFGPVTGRFYRWVILGGLAATLPAGIRRALAGPLVNGTLRDDRLMRMALDSRAFRRRMPLPGEFTDDDLRQVAVPVQVLLGARSALHPAAAVKARLSEVVPGWRVELVPGTGHALPVEAPELVADRILGFGGRSGARAAEKPRAGDDVGDVLETREQHP